MLFYKALVHRYNFKKHEESNDLQYQECGGDIHK